MKAFAWILFLAWGLYLYFGVTATTRSSVLCSTARDLPKNHLLASADLTCSSAGAATLFSGLYLRSDLAKGRQLAAEAVSDRPMLSVNPDDAIFMLDVSAEAAGKVDAGQKLDLGTPSLVLAKQAAVIAALNGSRGSGKYTLAVEVPQSALKPLVDAAGAVGIVDASKVPPVQAGGAPAKPRDAASKQGDRKDSKEGAKK